MLADADAESDAESEAEDISQKDAEEVDVDNDMYVEAGLQYMYFVVATAAFMKYKGQSQLRSIHLILSPGEMG